MTDTPERLCMACGQPLVRRAKESTADWRARNSCGQATNCTAKLIAMRKQQKPAALSGGGRACKTCGKPLVKAPGQSYRDFWRRETCGGSCSPHGVAHAREAREMGVSVEEYLAARRAQRPKAVTAPPPTDTRSDLQRWRDKWAVRLMEPDEEQRWRVANSRTRREWPGVLS